MNFLGVVYLDVTGNIYELVDSILKNDSHSVSTSILVAGKLFSISMYGMGVERYVLYVGKSEDMTSLESQTNRRKLILCHQSVRDNGTMMKINNAVRDISYVKISEVQDLERL